MQEEQRGRLLQKFLTQAKGRESQPIQSKKEEYRLQEMVASAEDRLNMSSMTRAGHVWARVGLG
ncbi:hypothetical protein KFK09_024185 [Dendrobium nobile]|uniref:Uncharacterized protein n=1 Tax=Dendrobium nobile TaxID=94219 RepID=A0A8T3ADE6_DENNO|nr:hypothetical protein KFK09_024185 [Dendrobium nobile]